MPLPGLTTDSSGMGTHTKSHAGQLPVCGKQPITDERIISASPSGRTLADVVGAGRRFRFKYASIGREPASAQVGAGRRFRFKYADGNWRDTGLRSGQDAVSGSSTLRLVGFYGQSYTPESASDPAGRPIATTDAEASPTGSTEAR